MDYGVVDDDQNVVGTIQFLPTHFKLWNSNQFTEEKKVISIYMHLKSFDNNKPKRPYRCDIILVM